MESDANDQDELPDTAPCRENREDAEEVEAAPANQEKDDEENDNHNEDDNDDDDDESDDDQSSQSDSDSSSGVDYDKDDNDDDGDDDDDDDDDDNSDPDDDDNNNASGEDGLSAYQRARNERIKRNQERLIELGLVKENEEREGFLGAKKKRQPQQKRKSASFPVEPTRKSRRSLTQEPKTYKEPSLREAGILVTANSTKEKKPKQPKPKKERPIHQQKRPVPEIYQEFQSIRRQKKLVLKQAQKNIKHAEKEVAYWQKKISKENASSKTTADMKERAIFDGLTAKEFLQQELDPRKPEILAKIQEFDDKMALPERLAEQAVRQTKHANKLKLLEAIHSIPDELGQMAETLSTALLGRTPNDNRPTPRRNQPRGVLVDEPKNEPTRKRGRRKKVSQQTPHESIFSTSQAAKRAQLSQIELALIRHRRLLERNEHGKSNSSTTRKTRQQTAPATTPTIDERNELSAAKGWISEAFANRLDRSWLEHDGPQSLASNSLKTLVPQVGETVLYYPAGHFEYLKQYPDRYSDDHNQQQQEQQLPLWERAMLQRSKQQYAERRKKKTSTTEKNNWWTNEWIDQATDGKYLLPILCRVEKTQAVFPPEIHNTEEMANTTSTTSTASNNKKPRKRPILRLAVTLKPLTPVTLPSWNHETGRAVVDDSKDWPLPPVFTCISFPSPQISPFIVPFAWSYIRNHLVSVGDEVGHSPVKASVTGKPLHQKGKLLSLATPEDAERYGDFRLDDKVDYVARVLSNFKNKKNAVFDLGNDLHGEGGAEPLCEISPQDKLVICDFLEDFLHKHCSSKSGNNTTHDDACTLMSLVRLSFPVWKGAIVQAGFEDRTRLDLQPWDLKAKGEVSASLTEFLDTGVHRTLDSMLRLKLECSIEFYIQERPETFPFQEQITDDVAPKYSSAVAIAMSFQRILNRLKQRGGRGGKPGPESPCYYRNIEAILADIQAIGDTCRIYNAADAPVVKSAEEITIASKRYVLDAVALHVSEELEKLKDEEAKKEFIAALLGENDVSRETPESRNMDSVGAFKNPWKGPMFRDWLQTTVPDVSWWHGQKRHLVAFEQWVPQAGDSVLYSPSMHAKFLKGHSGSLSEHQCLLLNSSPRTELQTQKLEPNKSAGESFGETKKWIPLKILSFRSEFPRIRKSSEEGTFATDAPLVCLTVKILGTSQFEKNFSIYWRPCMFSRDIANDEDPKVLSCKTCGIPISASFLRPSWSDHFGNALSMDDGEAGAPHGFDHDEMEAIAKNLEFLKRRCLHGTTPDSLDGQLTTEEVKNGYIPSHFKVGHSTLPHFGELLRPVDAEVPSKSFGTRGAKLPEVDVASLKSLASIGFLPPWLPSFLESTNSKSKFATTLHESMSPWPNLCLELVLLRIQNGYYRHSQAVHNDLAEAFINTQLLTWLPATKRKQGSISMKKLAKALSTSKYSLSISDRDTLLTSMAQAVAGKPMTAAQSLASIKVRITFDDSKEVLGFSAKKARKSNLNGGEGPVKPLGTKRIDKQNTLENEAVLIADVPISALRSIGRQEAVWVQCDKCKKWRRLRGEDNQNKLPSRWFCSMNKSDPDHAECSVAEEEFDDDSLILTGGSVATAGAETDLLSAEESAFEAHAEVTRRLYAAALVGISQPAHFGVIFGVTPLHVSSQKILSTIDPKIVNEADRRATFAREQLATLLDATDRDPSTNEVPLVVSLKVLVNGNPVSDKGISYPGISFGKHDLRHSNALTRALYGNSIKNRPCVRCQAARKGVYSCRVLKSHVNVSFDFLKTFKDGETLDDLLCTMMKVPKAPSGERGVSLQIQSVSKGSDREATALDDSGKSITVTFGDKKISPLDMFGISRNKLDMAKALLIEAERYAEAPARLSDEFIATTFPFDPRDNSYVYCIVCGLSGDLMLCESENCPNVMHYKCAGLETLPEEDWFCGQCVHIPPSGDFGDGEKKQRTIFNNKTDRAHKMSNGKKPASVTSSLPPPFRFDYQKAAKLSSELDDLYFARTGRRRGARDDDNERGVGQLKIGTLFQKKFGHQGMYTGEIISMQSADSPFYRVRYKEDGDEEELTEEEIRRLLAKSKKTTTKSKKEATKKQKKDNQPKESELIYKEDNFELGDAEVLPSKRRRGRPQRHVDPPPAKKRSVTMAVGGKNGFDVGSKVQTKGAVNVRRGFILRAAKNGKKGHWDVEFVSADGKKKVEHVTRWMLVNPDEDFDDFMDSALGGRGGK